MLPCFATAHVTQLVHAHATMYLDILLNDIYDFMVGLLLLLQVPSRALA